MTVSSDTKKSYFAALVASTLIIFSVLPTAARAASAAVTWQQRFGDPSNADIAAASAVDQSGNLYVGGLTGGRLARPLAGQTDAFIRKYGPAGQVLWSKQFGTAEIDSLEGISVDNAGNVFAAGTVSGALPGQTHQGGMDAFIRKYAGNGKLLWTRQFGTGGLEFGKEVAVGPSGAVYVVGTTDNSLGGRTPAGKADVYLRKYNSNGRLLWTRQFGTPEIDTGSSVVVDDFERVYVGGMVGGPLPGRRFAGKMDAFLRRFSPKGKVVWTRQFGTANDDGIGEAVVDSNQDIGLVGFRGASALVTKFKPNGTRLFTRAFKNYIAAGAAVDSQDNLYLTGARYGGQIQAFARKLTPAGATVWSTNIAEGMTFDAVVDGGDRLFAVGVAGSMIQPMDSKNNALVARFD